jgi:hypothetical protein
MKDRLTALDKIYDMSLAYSQERNGTKARKATSALRGHNNGRPEKPVGKWHKDT